MSVVDNEFFNSVFISYSHAEEDEAFAEKFREKLQDRLGDSIRVWIDKNLLEGKEWRREIQRKLNSAALVVIILSPDSARSPWVLYEWHYFLLVQQSEPFIVHFRRCNDKQLKRFTDYQLALPLVENKAQAETVWENKSDEIDGILEKIAERLHGFSELREHYDILTDLHKKTEIKQTAAYDLGNVPEGLKLAAANYLIEALEFWLSHGVYGPLGMSIANELGGLGKRKATNSLVRFFVSQVSGKDVYEPAINSVHSALIRLSCEDPI